MTIQTWLAFCAVAAVNIFSPGPAILLAITNGATKGMLAALLRRCKPRLPFGNARLGALVCRLSLASIIGVGALLAASATAFMVVKFIGAAYLIYLGIKQFRARNEPAFNPSATHNSAKSYGRTFSEGFMIAVTNPKAILFFIALFPLFLDQERSIAGQFIIMTISFQIISIISLTSYALLSRTAKSLFARPRFTKMFRTLTGGVFVSMGIGLLKVSAAQR